MVPLPSKPNETEISQSMIQYFIKYLLYAYMLNIGELEENLMDKIPAVVKTIAFSNRGKKNSFLLPHSHFPQHKISASVKQSPLEARSPNSFSMFAHPCIFLHVFWHKQESVLPHLPVTFLFPPLSTSPRCLESCLLVFSYVMNWVPSKIQFSPWSLSLNLWIPFSDIPKCPFLLSSYWKVSYEQKIYR